jgi:hypothetical protein
MKRYPHYPAVDAALVEANGGIPNKFLSDEDKEIAARFNVEAEIYKAKLIRLQAKFDQETATQATQLVPDIIMMTTTSKIERDRWLKYGYEVVDLIRKN